MPLTILNLEQGMPTVETARMRLEQGIRTARARRLSVIKIIHGYGSSGKGGAIKKDVRKVLTRKLAAKEIRGFVAGEDFSPFDPVAREIIDKCPEIRGDRDYTRGNHGITIVLI
ncbi:MAG: Smr/MutS family protein [Oscillospiraceae bacterium]|nr:Smr/MutS family protein [Oscillospiraceae bacterium]